MRSRSNPLKIKKILNNNAVVVKDGHEEKIVMGAGIGFQKRKNDIINKEKIEKIFVMKEENEKFQELLRTLPEEHIALAEDIISYAEKKLGTKLNNHIHIALTDHLSFAIDRIENGIKIENKLLNEIKVLYKKEFEIGMWAIRYVKDKLNVNMPPDEAGYIALHIHTAKIQDSSMENTLRQTTMINELTSMIEQELDIYLDQESLSYQGLITHLRFALMRAESDEPFHAMDQDMLALIKNKYTQEFQCAQKLAQYLENEYGIIFPESEIGYISLHLQRVADKA
ncbi:beta-glucoside operon transcriptional antiterminator [Caldalkalibacillus uzonensis]|uniref:Beta-glucoside operon transcriptional antiterminator n=1 Tax=Caldalkalibacillus uzonensis TaxID=353224 RepID=A0ABU0CM40_9BACI|nr:PRD domain-containing protein [Caldalkalibacillus uzonensis]MDQ0337475.1 beta-glucoside operon transcriptional antiterminator [Caldalkalibacillus uzonensis]